MVSLIMIYDQLNIIMTKRLIYGLYYQFITTKVIQNAVSKCCVYIYIYIYSIECLHHNTLNNMVNVVKLLICWQEYVVAT